MLASRHPGYLKAGIHDFVKSVKRWQLITLLGYHDIRQRYQRSILGPFWLTISMGVMIGCIGVVFGSLFKSDLSEFLPFLAAGLILWTFILSCVTEGSTTFISEARTIQQVPMPLTVYILKMIWRNLIILAHNVAIIPLVMLIFGIPLTFSHLLFIPGLILLTFNLIWVALIISVICVRFRDMPQIVASLMQILFYISPILWSPALLQESHRSVIVNVNPIYYLLDITRSPILGQQPHATSWIVCCIILGIGFPLAVAFYGRFVKRIPYWL